MKSHSPTATPALINLPAFLEWLKEENPGWQTSVAQCIQQEFKVRARATRRKPLLCLPTAQHHGQGTRGADGVGAALARRAPRALAGERARGAPVAGPEAPFQWKLSRPYRRCRGRGGRVVSPPPRCQPGCAGRLAASREGQQAL